MHSSRMRTVRCSSHLGGGLYARGGVCLRGVCPGAPCGQTDTCENITFPQLLLRTVITIVLSVTSCCDLLTDLIQRVCMIYFASVTHKLTKQFSFSLHKDINKACVSQPMYQGLASPRKM